MPRGARPEGPWGAVVARQVVAEAAKGWTPGLTCFTGDDVFHLDMAMTAVLAALVDDPQDPFALTVFRDGRIPASELAGATRSRGMFAASRVVVLRDIAIVEGEPDALRELAAEPPDGGYLLVRAPKLDRKRKLHQAVLSGRALEFRNPENGAEATEMAREIAQLAVTRGIKLKDDAIGFLVEACEGDLVRIVSELDKIRDWASPGQALGARDLSDIVTGGDTLTGWELGDQIMARDGARALETARRYANAGEQAIKIVGGLAWRARTLLQAKAMAEAGARPDQIVQAARAWGYRDALLAGIRRFTLDELLAFPARLLEADRALKSRQIPPGAVLESLVATLTESKRDREELR